jgi:hypothetical protein
MTNDTAHSPFVSSTNLDVQEETQVEKLLSINTAVESEEQGGHHHASCPALNDENGGKKCGH